MQIRTIITCIALWAIDLISIILYAGAIVGDVGVRGYNFDRGSQMPINTDSYPPQSPINVWIPAAQGSFSPARPPAIPLAVKSPYLSTWQFAGSDGGTGGLLAGQWPMFWAGQITGWAGLIRVDGTTYTWMGKPGYQAVEQTSFDYTSTRSVFTMDVGGKVQMKIEFLSPVFPTDIRRQSLEFSYLTVTLVSTDGDSHSVQLYSDISAEWVSGDRSAVAQWEYGVVGDVAYHKVYRQNQLLFSEDAQQAAWGSWYWATDNVDGLTYQSGADVDVRGAFAGKGKLPNSKDTNWRPISQDWPVMGFAVDLGNLGPDSSKTTRFSIGMCQEQAVQFDGAKGVQPVPPLWRNYFDSDLAALGFFHGDYSQAAQSCDDLDSKISQDSVNAAGKDYQVITTLAVRQTFAAMQLCGTQSQYYLFLKEISSNGNCQTVDVIFPAHPIFLYTNPELLKLLLDPLYENQESGQYPNMYSIHDLGTNYPNVTGHPDGKDEYMPLEECGNMLIMSLAYSQRSDNIDYLQQHYDILKQWTGYLIDEALHPANQISTDDFAGALSNQTNLALKGIIGIEAMATIANLTGNDADAQNYTNIAHNYMQQWMDLAIAQNADPPHTTLSYGFDDTHGLLYNLYCDKEIQTNIVPESVYDMQSNFYPSIKAEYGVPLDTRHSYTKSDWELFVAAVASEETRDMFHSLLAHWINVTPTNKPLTDLYDTATGNYPGIYFAARPVMGAAFALLALDT